MAVSLPRGVDQRSLLLLLADGRLHSGARLARALGVGRGAVRDEIERLRGAGVQIDAPAGRGYRLPGPVELLDARQIRSALSEERDRQVRSFELLFVVDSTNTRLLGLPAPPAGHATAGRKRLPAAESGPDRQWPYIKLASFRFRVHQPLSDFAAGGQELHHLRGVLRRRSGHSNGYAGHHRQCARKPASSQHDGYCNQETLIEKVEPQSRALGARLFSVRSHV